MEILIILIAWFSVGFIYLINLCGSKEIDNLSKKAVITILIIFLPTTIFIYIISGIEELVKRLRNGKRKM